MPNKDAASLKCADHMVPTTKPATNVHIIQDGSPHVLITTRESVDYYVKEGGTVSEPGITLSPQPDQHPDEFEMVEIPDGQESKLFLNLGLDLCDVTTMKVKAGSKVRNLLGFALKKIKEEATRSIIFTGSGPAISKTITCVEIIKRNVKTLQQISKIFYKRSAEYWNPKEEELDRLKVTRHIPAIAVLLSKESLDTKEPGYQGPGLYTGLPSGSNQGKTRKRTNPHKAKQTKRPVQSSSTPEDSKKPSQARDGARRQPSAKKNQNRKNKGNVQTKREEAAK